MKVLFLQTVHLANDDRIIHQMNTMRQVGIECVYAQSRDEVGDVDVVICDTPKAVLMNIGHKGLVIYDVTEWYPSKKNLRSYHVFLRPFAFVAMVLLSLLAGMVADRFIFGEHDKGKPFRLLFRWKKYVYLPYYPSLQWFPTLRNRHNTPLKVLYAGPLTEEKGYNRVLNVAKHIGIDLTIIGPDHYMPLDEFCRYIQDFDVALDLRDMDVENKHCLPIKLFYYWAAGVVPIYSDLSAIRKHISDVEKAIFLVRDENEVVTILNRLATEPSLLQQYQSQGRQLYWEKYHWEAVAERLTSIISHT